jgi:hypothetical protein
VVAPQRDMKNCEEIEDRARSGNKRAQERPLHVVERAPRALRRFKTVSGEDFIDSIFFAAPGISGQA